MDRKSWYGAESVEPCSSKRRIQIEPNIVSETLGRSDGPLSGCFHSLVLYGRQCEPFIILHTTVLNH